MLIYIARALKEAFENEDVYRMGGDEFMVCGSNKAETELTDALDKFHKKIEKAEYSVSIGLAYQQQNPFDMVSMMNRAEKLMLLDKRKFYEQSGIDRRRKE